MPSIVDVLGLPDRSRDEEYFSKFQGGGKKQVFQEKVRRARRRRQRRRRKRQPDISQLAAELFTDDLITGGPGTVPAEGIIPYGSMPEAIRREIPLSAPPIGWDPEKLSPQKLFLLRRLQALGQEMAFRQQ